MQLPVPPPKTQTIHIRVTEKEYARLIAEAKASNLRMSDHVRRRLGLDEPSTPSIDDASPKRRVKAAAR